MCSYITLKAPVTGSAKGPEGWFGLTHAMAYYDHPYHSPYEHTLNLDFLDERQGPSARVAVELTAEAARELVSLIEGALEAARPLLGAEGPARSAAEEEAFSER